MMKVKQLQILIFLFIFNSIISQKNQKPPKNPPKNNTNTTTPKNPPKNNTNISTTKPIVTIPVKNKTFSFRTNGDFLVFNLKYKTSRKTFLRLIIIYLSTLILLSLIYSCYKVSLRSKLKGRNCKRAKYFLKSFFFLFFIPCTLAYILMTGLFGFLDGIFPDNNLINSEEDNIKKKKAKKKYKNNVDPELSEAKKF